MGWGPTRGDTDHIGVVQGIGECPVLYRAENTGAARHPEEEHHGLEDQRALVVVQVELLWVVSLEVADHVDRQYDAA